MECDDNHERKTIQLELLKNIQIISYAAREADENSLMHGQSSHEMEDFSILILIKKNKHHYQSIHKIASVEKGSRAHLFKNVNVNNLRWKN